MRRSRQGRFWQNLVWALVLPRNTNRAEPTASGMVLIALCFAVGMAAYNSANNILFIALSLLLGSLILSGMLSWLNLRRVDCVLGRGAPARAGQDTSLEFLVGNRGRLMPVQGLWFEFQAEPLAPAAASGAVRSASTLRERLASLDTRLLRGRVELGSSLGPGEERRLAWSWVPPSRGRWRVELVCVGSLFPFGFLRKRLAWGAELEVLVRPAPIAVTDPSAAARMSLLGLRDIARGGGGNDLLSLREYRPGDSHRLIHWKASARQGTLLVRECAAEAESSFVLHFDASRELWPDPAAFERALRVAASLAELLQRKGSLRELRLGSELQLPLRRSTDIEVWLDRLAELQPAQNAGTLTPARQARGCITFTPDKEGGVAIYVDGCKVSTA